MKIINVIFLAVILLIFFSCSKQNSFPILKGPYMGQTTPGMEPELFAPGIISNGMANRDVAISPDGKEMYFGIHTPDFSYSSILFTKQINNVWTKPELLPFATNPKYVHLEPALSKDGNTLFFLSTMPNDSSDKPTDEDIWCVDRVDNGWGKPYNLGEPVNSKGSEFFPSLTNDGTIYFTRREPGQREEFIYRSKFINGKYTTVEKLPKQVNCGTNRFNAYISPDESYIIVPAIGMKDGLGGVDYYIVFRNEDDTWEEPINLGSKINTPTGANWSFYVTRDQKYIFYMATKGLPADKIPNTLNYNFFSKLKDSPLNGNPDIFWVDAKIIEDLRPKKQDI